MELTIDEALQKGIEAQKAGQIQEANRLYTDILQAQPKHPDANHNMGVLAVGVGKVTEALPFFKTALEAGPSIAQFWLSLIDAFIKLGEIEHAKILVSQAKSKGIEDKAFSQLEQRIDQLIKNDGHAVSDNRGPTQSEDKILNTKSLNHVLRLAKQKSREGSTDEAKRIYQNIIDKFPKNQRALEGIRALSRGTVEATKSHEPEQNELQVVIDLYSKGQLTQVLTQATQMLHQFPKSSTLYNILGVANAGLKQFDTAIVSYKQAIQNNPSYAEAYNNLGNALKNQGELDAAINSYKKAININPNKPEAYNNMGNALKDQGDLDAAIDSYEQAIKINPNNAEHYNNMGAVLQDQGDLDAAIDSYKQAIKINPSYAKAYNNVGVALQDQGDSEASIVSYKQAIKINPTYAEAYNNMAVSLQESGDIDAAIYSFKQAIKINPSSAEAYSNMGNALKDQGNLEAAIDSYKQAIKINPSYAEAYSNIGVVLKEGGNSGKALINFKRSVELKPKLPLPYFYIGSIYHENSDIDLALDILKEGNYYNPGEKIIKIALKVLEKLQIKEKNGNIKHDKDVKNRILASEERYVIINRHVENDLVLSLYDMQTRALNNTNDARYGNGSCSRNFNLFDTESHVLKKVSDDLQQLMEEAVGSRIFIFESFFNILQSGGGSKPHTHINNYDNCFGLGNKKYSLVYYLSVGDQNCEDPGILKLYNPDRDILPMDGMVVIIPGSRYHSAVYGGQDDRVMIGINFYTL